MTGLSGASARSQNLKKYGSIDPRGDPLFWHRQQTGHAERGLEVRTRRRKWGQGAGRPAPPPGSC